MTFLCCNMLSAKQVDPDIVMYTYAKYHQAEELYRHHVIMGDAKNMVFTLGQMEALLDMLEFYDSLNNYNRGWSDS